MKSSKKRRSPSPEPKEKDDDDAGSEEYVVEKVKRKRMTQEGKEMYLIKWEGYSESENTWEPKEYLNCPKLIAKFEKKAKKRRDFLEEKKKRRQVLVPLRR